MDWADSRETHIIMDGPVVKAPNPEVSLLHDVADATHALSHAIFADQEVLLLALLEGFQ